MARFLALDWDQNQLHIISAELRGSSVQVRRALALPEQQSPNPAQIEELGKVLRERLREAGIQAAPVLGCLGRDRLIVKEVRFPSVPEAEEPAVVRFQTVKELTDQPEDVIIDYVISGGTPGGEQRATALIVRKEILETYQKICEAAGLKLAALAPRLIGASACLRKVMGATVVTPPPEPADGIICLVMLGEKQAEIAILRGQNFLLARSVPASPSLVGEIRRALVVHAGQSPNDPVRALYIAGKGSGELRERLSELVEVPVHTFDPFASAESLDLPSGNRGGFAGAMGLLHLRTVGDLPINFASPRQPKPQTNPNYRLIRLAVVACLALVIGLVVLGRYLQAKWSEDLSAVAAEREKIEEKLVSVKENAKRLKGIDDWDSPVSLDELFEVNRVNPDVNALRVTSYQVEPITRNPKTKAVAKATIKGKLLDKRNPRRPLDQFVSQLSKEGFYTADPPKVEKDEFTLVVHLERRGPTDYRLPLLIPELKEYEDKLAKIMAEKAAKAKAKSTTTTSSSSPGKSKEKEKEKPKEEVKDKDKSKPADKSGSVDKGEKSSSSAKPSQEEEVETDVDQ